MIHINKTTIRILAMVAFSGVLHTAIYGQGLTLHQCLDYAYKNNSNIINAHYDLAIAGKKVNEQIGTFLPQLEATGSVTDNLELSTTVLPGEMSGQPGTSMALKMGTQYNVTGGIQLSQKIFDPSSRIDLNSAKLNQEQSEVKLQQTTENMQYNICYLYYQTLVIEKQRNSLLAAYDASKAVLESTELLLTNGMAQQIDLDKIRVSTNVTYTQLKQCLLNYDQSLNNLKFTMGMPIDTGIFLTDTIVNVQVNAITLPADTLLFQNRFDYKLQQIGLRSSRAEIKRNEAGYLPVLSFTAYYGSNAMRNEFTLFNREAWYPNSYIGLTLRLSVFDGFQRQSRISQAKLNVWKSKENIRQTRQSIKVELSNSEIGYRNALANIQNEKENLGLADKVYKSTQLQYKQGTCSTLDLIQSETSYRESLNNYYNELLNFLIARIKLEQSKGTLSEYIHNLN